MDRSDAEERGDLNRCLRTMAPNRRRPNDPLRRVRQTYRGHREPLSPFPSLIFFLANTGIAPKFLGLNLFLSTGTQIYLFPGVIFDAESKFDFHFYESRQKNFLLKF